MMSCSLLDMGFKEIRGKHCQEWPQFIWAEMDQNGPVWSIWSRE